MTDKYDDISSTGHGTFICLLCVTICKEIGNSKSKEQVIMQESIINLMLIHQAINPCYCLHFDENEAKTKHLSTRTFTLMIRLVRYKPHTTFNATWVWSTASKLGNHVSNWKVTGVTHWLGKSSLEEVKITNTFSSLSTIMMSELHRTASYNYFNYQFDNCW